MSIVFCVGEWGGFHFHVDDMTIRVTIGFVAFWFLRTDFEKLLEYCLRLQKAVKGGGV